MKKTVFGVLWGIVALALAVVVWGAVGIYGFKWVDQYGENSRFQTLVRVIPYPLSMVKGQVISINSYLEDLKLASTFYANQYGLDFTTDDGKDIYSQIKDDVRTKTETDVILNGLAKKESVTISQSEIDEQYGQVVGMSGQEASAVEELIRTTYGLSVDDFKEKVLSESVLRSKLESKLSEQEGWAEQARAEAEVIRQRILAGEISFEDAARESSDDPGSAAEGGALGWLTRGVTVAEFESAAFALNTPGQISEIIETEYGYHLIKLEEKKTDDTGDQVKCSHILVTKMSLTTRLDEELAKTKVWRLI